MTSEPQPLFCPFCGKARAANWAFCQFCGKALPLLETSGRQSESESLSSADPFGQLWQTAQERFHRDDLDAAQRCLEGLLAKSPDHPEALALLGTIYMRSHRVEEAGELLERAITLAPASAFVRLRLAEYWLALGVPSRAQEELRVALAAADNPALHDSIRFLIRKLEQGSRWSFVRSPTGPSLKGISRWLRRPTGT